MASLYARDQNQAAALLNAKAAHTEGRSLQSFLASLSVGGAIFVVEMLAFLLLRANLSHIYHPRSRTGKPFLASDVAIIDACGLDAYLFLRYLKTLLRIFVPLSFIILPVLLPINYSAGGEGNGVTGLDRLSWTNVDSGETHRYWAHLCLSLVVVVWVCRVFRYEMQVYTRLRQRRMMAQSGRPVGTTILVTDVPPELQTSKKLKELYDIYPGGVRRVRMHRDYRQLTQRLMDRDDLALTLEAAETRLILKANATWRKTGRYESEKRPVWRRYLSLKDREYCRLPIMSLPWFPALPWMGAKVDLIDHCRARLSKLNDEIDAARSSTGRFQVQSSALIEFNEARGAQMACRSVHHPLPHVMGSKLVEETSEHVLWKNLAFVWWERYLRSFVVGGLAISLCLLSVIPVAFTGLLSQLNYLASLWPWLDFLKEVPGWFQGVLQGVLPPLLLAAVMITVPIVLQRLILDQAIHTVTAAELILQDYYFGFLFLQVFLVASVSSSVAAVLSGLKSDSQPLASLIAQNLPKAGNYFFSYILLQGFSVSAGALLQFGQLFGLVLGPLMDTTPRQIRDRQKNPDVKWGTFFPVYTNLAAIGLIYSVVSPLVLVCNILSFSLFLVVQQYIILGRASFKTDTGGLVYPKAINQLFVGLYAMEAYLIGLFALVRNQQGEPACIAQAIIMLMVLLATICYQTTINHTYGPLSRSLPVTYNNLHGRNCPKTGTEGVQTPDLGFLGLGLSQSELLNTISGQFPTNASLYDQGGKPDADGEQISDHGSDCLEIGPDTIGSAKPHDDTLEIKDTVLDSNPTVWIPKDCLGISEDEILQTRKKNIVISNDDATVDENGKVGVGNH